VAVAHRKRPLNAHGRDRQVCRQGPLTVFPRPLRPPHA